MSSSRISLSCRAAAVVAVVLSAGAASGCYVYEPVTASMIAPGKSVAIDLNDLGRLNLAPLIGPEVKRVSGVLVSQSANDYVIRVTELTFFNRRESQWSGEAVTVLNSYASGLFEEKLSASKSVLAVAAGAAGIGGLLAAKNLIATGNSGNDPQPRQPGPTTQRGNQ